MLVLSRKVGERIHIGNDIFVEVRRVAGSRVTLAINAPKSVRILRGELVESANSFDVLEESPSSEAERDTVIIRQQPKTGKQPAPETTPSMASPSTANVSECIDGTGK